MVSIFSLILSQSIGSMIHSLCCFSTASAGKWPRHTKKTDGCGFCGSSVGAHAYQWSLGWFSLFDWWWEQWVTDHLVWCISLLYCILLCGCCVFSLLDVFFSLLMLNGSAMLHCSPCSLLSLSSSISILCFYFSPLFTTPTHPPIMSPTISTSPPHIFQGRSSDEDVFAAAAIPHVIWLYQETQHNFTFKSIMSPPVDPVRGWILHLEDCVGVVLMLQYGNAVIMSTLIPVEAGIHVRQTQISPPSHLSNCWDYVWQWRGQEAM